MAKTARRSIASDPLPPKNSSDHNRTSQKSTSPTPIIDRLRSSSSLYYTTQTIPRINYTGSNHSQPFRYKIQTQLYKISLYWVHIIKDNNFYAVPNNFIMLTPTATIQKRLTVVQYWIAWQPNEPELEWNFLQLMMS